MNIDLSRPSSRPATAGAATLSPGAASMELLNSEYFCISLDASALRQALESEIGEPGLFELIQPRCPYLFATRPFFLSHEHARRMALTLACGGRRVVVHEARPCVGYRFGGDLQPLDMRNPRSRGGVANFMRPTNAVSSGRQIAVETCMPDEVRGGPAGRVTPTAVKRDGGEPHTRSFVEATTTGIGT